MNKEPIELTMKEVCKYISIVNKLCEIGIMKLDLENCRATLHVNTLTEYLEKQNVELHQENKLLREKLKATNKGLIKVLSKRLKWKRRYYKEKYLKDKLTKQLTDEYKNTEVQCELKNKYKDILEEFKKWLEEKIPYYKEIGYDNTYLALTMVLAKIKELEEGVKE